MLVVQAAGWTTNAQAPNLDALIDDVREVLRREYAAPVRFTYLEHSRDIDISTFGKVSVGPLRTFEVYPTPTGDWKRLIAVEGKSLDPTELARRDAEHQKDVRKQLAESPRQKAQRARREEEETRDREAILDDAKSVYEIGFVNRETVDGQPVIVVSLTPRPNARVTTREGNWMKQFAGRMWIAQADHSIARLKLHAVDDVSIGWGVVARLEPGSGFDYIRKRVGGAWLPSELTVQASGRTLLFRRFDVKAITTYTGHQPLTPEH